MEMNENMDANVKKRFDSSNINFDDIPNFKSYNLLYVWIDLKELHLTYDKLRN